MLRFSKWLLVSMAVVILTACGGGGSPTEPTAIQQIATYAKDGGTAPTVQMYQDAGVTGVTVDNLNEINAVVAGLSYEDVDTAAEIQALVDRLGLDIIDPIFTSPATVSVAENQTTAITLVATDTSTVTYSISGTDANSFTVDASSGIVTFKTAPDYETKTSYLFTATATDSEGNSAMQSVTITITDVDDTAPVFTSSASVSVAENQTSAITLVATDTNTITYSVSGADSASFDVDSATGVVTFKTAPDYETKTSYLFTATATDSEGNSATQSVTITITDVDEVPPVITLNGDNPMEVAQGGTFDDPGATATDDVDGAVSVTTSGSVDTQTIATYTITYHAVDVAGNEAMATRSVEVKDVTPPVISLIGPDEIIVFVGATYTDPGATAEDNLDGNITSDEITVISNVDTTTEGNYTVTYNVADVAGNNAEENRTVRIVHLSTRGTDQNQSIDMDNHIVTDGSIKDDGYYQKGISPVILRNDATGIVTDYLTGMMWQDNDGLYDIKKRWVTLSNYDDGNYDDTSGDTAATYCEDLSLGGYTDWRLPDIHELISVTVPYITKHIFENGSNGGITWTKNEYQADEYNEIYLYSAGYAPNKNEKKDRLGIRCVRNIFSPSIVFSRDDTNKVVTDTVRHLMWQDDDAARTTHTDWEGALDYCEDLVMGGYDDWRMPNVHEFESIVDKSRTNPAIDTIFQSGYLGEYWTSTTAIGTQMAVMASLDGDSIAILFSLKTGLPGDSIDGTGYAKDEDFHVRCVRDE